MAAAPTVDGVHRVVLLQQRDEQRHHGGVGAGPVDEHERWPGSGGAVADAYTVDRLDVGDAGHGLPSFWRGGFRCRRSRAELSEGCHRADRGGAAVVVSGATGW